MNDTINVILDILDLVDSYDVEDKENLFFEVSNVFQRVENINSPNNAEIEAFFVVFENHGIDDAAIDQFLDSASTIIEDTIIPDSLGELQSVAIHNKIAHVVLGAAIAVGVGMGGIYLIYKYVIPFREGKLK